MSSSTVAMQAALCAFGGRAVPLYPRGTDPRCEDPAPRAGVDVVALWDEYRWVAVAVLILLLLYVALGDEAAAPGPETDKKEGGAPPAAATPPAAAAATPSPGLPGAE